MASLTELATPAMDPFITCNLEEDSSSSTSDYGIEDLIISPTGDSSGPTSRYIAVGCLCFFQPGIKTQSAGVDLHWSELRSLEDLKQLLPSDVAFTDLAFLGRLLEANWIRITAANRFGNIVLRVFILPDDVAQSTHSRHSRPLRDDLRQLCFRLDVSPRAWKGSPASSPANRYTKFDLWATGVDRSLFWLFNDLPSPRTEPWNITDRFTRYAVEDILSSSPTIPDLKAKLYQYQARTVAAMMQKETVSQRILDPRFEQRKSVDGINYYYNARETQFRLDPPQFESNRGGILAETMGVGKTVMCIALILATKYHLPKIPPEHSTQRRTREMVGSLAQMAVANAGKYSVPLRSHFHSFYDPDMDLRSFFTPIDADAPNYEVPYPVRRSNRSNSVLPPPRKLILCSTTIVVVPGNLLRQWQAELEKHANVGPTGLRVLVMEKSKDRLPAASEIAKNDIVLFSKTRFEAEHKDGQDDQGRSKTNVRAGCSCPYIGATRTRDCVCLRLEDVYHSPLKNLHVLRIIIDEGHEFSSSSSHAVRVATDIVTAERRWIVSGTPAKQRLVDVELAGTSSDEDNETPLELEFALNRRKRYVQQEEMNGASKPIGILLSNFLRVRPWASVENESKVEWEEYAFRHEVSKGRTHTMFSTCMESTLNSLVLKTRPKDVKRDVYLPKLHRETKYLKPSFYDIATLNLFIFFMTANAVTSERTDVDYLFHKNSTSARHTLIRNLRHSAFFWTGLSENDIYGAISNSERYLSKPEEEIKCSEEDRKNLEQCISFARVLLNSRAWISMSRTHELGIFLDHWPNESGECWSLNGVEKPLMVGATQARSAQKFINGTLFDENPTQGLDLLGNEEKQKALEAEENEIRATTKKKWTTPMKVEGVPISALQDKHLSVRHNGSPKKATSNRQPAYVGSQATDASSIPQSTAPKRKRSNTLDTRELPADSPLTRTSIIGTASSKLTYLLGRIMALQSEEKILIFYDYDNAAYYISQVLDLVHIKHLIYERTLRPELKSKYIVNFDTDNSIRVLLMDINHGAFGLNVNKASRVFFINPPINPHTEVQAIKRAHRIGQTKEVFVETLVLEGTIEHSIFERGKVMTGDDYKLVGKDISNDGGVAKIIQSAKSIPITTERGTGSEQMAPLSAPLQLFGRKGRHDTKIRDIDQLETDGKTLPKKRRKQRNVEAGASKSVEPQTTGLAVTESIGSAGDRSIFG